MKVYFDNAATTPMRKEVIESISSVMEECYGNPSSSHAFGRSAKTYVETARKGIANLLNAITAGIAANKPTAVAINASAIPGATFASVAC